MSKLKKLVRHSKIPVCQIAQKNRFLVPKRVFLKCFDTRQSVYINTTSFPFPALKIGVKMWNWVEKNRETWLFGEKHENYEISFLILSRDLKKREKCQSWHFFFWKTWGDSSKMTITKIQNPDTHVDPRKSEKSEKTERKAERIREKCKFLCIGEKIHVRTQNSMF